MPKISHSLLAVVLASLLIPAAAFASAGPFPQTVAYEGQAVDAEGQPLNGIHTLTFRYFGIRDEEILAETMREVKIEDGRFDVNLGTGETLAGGAYESLQTAFADHPEVMVQVTIGERTYAPKVGILPGGHSLKSRLVAQGLRAQNDDLVHWKHYERTSDVTAMQAAILAPAGSLPEHADPSLNVRRNPYLVPVVGPMRSPAVRDLAPYQAPAVVKDPVETNTPRHEALFDANGNRFGTIAPKQDDVLAANSVSAASGGLPNAALSFDGVNNLSGVFPPDTEGTVGPNHYVQVVNSFFAIYDKLGNQLVAPAQTNTLWAGFGGPCQNFNNGDAIFMYDQQADRYVLTQFAVSAGANSVCVAVSTTNDPTGTYNLYQIVTPRFPDYYKLGVWPVADNNAYFMGTNSGFQGQYDVFALDRENMLAGAAARPIQVFQNFPNLIMPADSDGATPPPAGTPGLLYSTRDGGEPYFFNPPADSIDIYEFDVDWVTPANTTFTLAQEITNAAGGLADFNWTVCGFFVQACIPQPGTAQRIDSASWWPMQRLVHRTFDNHETLVGAWTVDVLAAGDRAAPRWFELRRDLAPEGGNWDIHQQGTFSPDAIHRWMPSIAMDGSGNIAMGYSRGDGSEEADIYYTARFEGDPLGTMQSEVLLHAAGGVQTGGTRWGDYSSMEVDPVDDCTFWYTNEYLQNTGGAPWRTRVLTFTMPGCGNGLFRDGFESGDVTAWDGTGN